MPRMRRRGPVRPKARRTGRANPGGNLAPPDARVARRDRGGDHPHQHLAFAGNRPRHFRDARDVRRTVSVHDDRPHGHNTAPFGVIARATRSSSVASAPTTTISPRK